MFIYLNKENFKKFESLLGSSNLGLQIKHEKFSDAPYFEINEDPFCPTFIFPDNEDFLAQFISRVTVRNYTVDNANCYRPEGLYQIEETILRCRHTKVIAGSGTTVQVWGRMIIDISAPSIFALKKMFSQFREGKIHPVNNWEVASAAHSCANCNSCAGHTSEYGW